MTAHHQDIPRRIKTILAEHITPHPCKAEDIREDDTLERDLTVDSLDLIQIAIALESEFVIDVMHEDLVPVVTVGDLIDFVTAEVTERHRVGLRL
jgi:acyl carrier protein